MNESFQSQQTIISKLFNERSNFILLGLTGRTGSGCTSASLILEEKTPLNLSNEDLKYKDNYFYQGFDSIRQKITADYISKNYTPFITIKVSDLISAYILQLPKNEIAKYLQHITKSTKSAELAKLIRNGAFTNNSIVKHQIFKEINTSILNHSKELSLTPRHLSKFFSYMKSIKKFTSDFKKDLNSISSDLYVKLYQDAGNLIRKEGSIKNYSNPQFHPASVYSLPESINRCIKTIRSINGQAGSYIAIDAIRNPYEAKFFKDRYSAFYLVSINATNEDRKSYLQDMHKYTTDQFERLDSIESGKFDGKKEDKPSYFDFINQNIKKCSEIADIHIFNPRSNIKNTNILRSQLYWYISLIKKPGICTPTKIERNMQIAFAAKLNSGCISRQVGAVVTDSNQSVKSVGWNDVAEGQVSCGFRNYHGLLTSFDNKIYSNYELKNNEIRSKAAEKFEILNNKLNNSGKYLSYCFKELKNSIDDNKNQVHTRALHAEENAFLQLAKYGNSPIQGGNLYTTASPCELCAKKAYQLGIKNIYYIDPYPGISLEHIIETGTNSPSLVQFRGALGRAYHSLYEQIIPYKDELDYVIEN
ncbi:anti-phage dCTP deaminase [Comamonas aquatica]|jgi:dCMP deaminase|uniref:anti-phage dCTP deaminase n=1 Tax=Comamonas aquatica TaxID=225991 RepID=UPI00244C635D|nr:anti-phage dCTP deaminase [Comamonas aquatica]MDH1765031.1 anti-phage dCTP deaminase [Comamonas aquatica]